MERKNQRIRDISRIKLIGRGKKEKKEREREKEQVRDRKGENGETERDGGERKREIERD